MDNERSGPYNAFRSHVISNNRSVPDPCIPADADVAQAPLLIPNRSREIGVIVLSETAHNVDSGPQQDIVFDGTETEVAERSDVDPLPYPDGRVGQSGPEAYASVLAQPGYSQPVEGPAQVVPRQAGKRLNNCENPWNGF